MHFGLTADESIFREQVSVLALKEFREGYLDRATRAEFPWAQYRELGRHGLLGLMIGEEYGGQAATFVAAGAALESLAYADFNVAFLAYFAGLSSVESLMPAIVRREVLPRITRGEEILAYAITEPGGGSDVGATRTKATRTAGGWLLSGEKTSVSLVEAARHAIVFARVDGAPGGKGVGAFLVDLAGPGVSRSRLDDIGCLPLGRGSIFFDDVFVADDLVSATPGDGFAAIVETFNYSRPFLGLMCLAAAQASVDEAITYAGERTAFGAPICDYQGVAFPLVEAQTRLAGARHLCYEALWLRDQSGGDQRRQGAMSKWFAVEESLHAIQAAMITLGHYAYTTDSPMQQRQRDVTGVLFAEGPPQLMKRIATRSVWAPQR